MGMSKWYFSAREELFVGWLSGNIVMMAVWGCFDQLSTREGCVHYVSTQRCTYC